MDIHTNTRNGQHGTRRWHKVHCPLKYLHKSLCIKNSIIGLFITSSTRSYLNVIINVSNTGELPVPTNSNNLVKKNDFKFILILLSTELCIRSICNTEENQLKV